jgi:hypothetical protein
MKPNLAKDHGRGPSQPVTVPSIIREGTSFSSHLSNVPPFDVLTSKFAFIFILFDVVGYVKIFW